MEAKINSNLYTIRKRSDFILASRAKRASSNGINIQARQRKNNECVDKNVIRVGITCTKKVGNAVTRNRAKRRLRELSREVIPSHGNPGWDYVLIGKPIETCERSFKLLLQDLKDVIRRVHNKNLV